MFAAEVLGRSMGTEDAEVGGGQIKEGKKGLVHSLEFVNRLWGPGLLSWERKDAFLPQLCSVDCSSLQRCPALPQTNSASPPRLRRGHLPVLSCHQPPSDSPSLSCPLIALRSVGIARLGPTCRLLALWVTNATLTPHSIKEHAN